jgi:hydrogenase maturation protein HypF
MSEFKMCGACLLEYENPKDRRFHAQIISCPECGPVCELKNIQNQVLAKSQDAIEQALQEISNGKVIAIKGIGGFHLVCDAGRDDAILSIRKFKNRFKKPFAIMCKDLRSAQSLSKISDLESELLNSSSAPIVLLIKESNINISKEVAPDISRIGVMLPYNPLYQILLDRMHGALVVTSGNFQDEPICTSDAQAIERLREVSSLILTHNREIIARVDDSVVQEVLGKAMVLRAGRGLTPMFLQLNTELRSTGEEHSQCWALGGHQKNTVSMLEYDKITLFPHFGDLSSLEARHRERS